MRRGEKGIFIVMAIIVGAAMVKRMVENESVNTARDREIPFYTTFSKAENEKALDLIRDNHCKECHSLWGGAATMMQSVPAPRLDGIGSIRDEKWFYAYLSSSDPQSILPSRMKPEFRMPSYAKIPDSDRQEIAKYLSSLKVKNWYLMDTRKAEYEKLTGKEFHP